MEAELNQMNSYWNNFKKDEAVATAKQRQAAAETNAKGFDNVFSMEDEEPEQADFTGNSRNEYTRRQLAKMRDENRMGQAAVVTSGQTLGWRTPYDNLQGAPHNRSGMCKRTFADTGHL